MDTRRSIMHFHRAIEKSVPFSLPAAFTGMKDFDDAALLRQYVEENSDEAFAAIVTRHVDKVYSVALRHTRKPHEAEEITQTVFVLLAKKSRHFGKGVILSGWLYQTARLTALTFVRSEIRRANREQEAYMQSSLNETDSDVWPQIAPLLDRAMAGLNKEDRQAVVLRFFDRRTMSEVGYALGASEDAAKKRVNRAIGKLRLFFAKRGVALSAGVLTTVISTNSVQAAPVGLAKTISVVALAHGAATSGSVMVFAASAGKCVGLIPLLGSVFFHLKAEIENTKSPRERQFIIRMIWFRFTVAFLLTAVPIMIALVMPSILLQPGVIEFGFIGFCFLGAVEATARMVYFHRRRRRQIQIEDGTWEEADRVEETKPAGLLADLSVKTSQANRYAAISAVFGLVGGTIVIAILVTRMLTGGRWIAALLVLLLYGFVSLRSIRKRRQRQRLAFGERFGTLVKVVVFHAAMSLLIINLSWARGRLPQSDMEAIGSNISIVLAYAGLIGVLAKCHRQSIAPPHSTPTAIQ
jgi:RNA polymerase sigma factor (sigma-70 family)